MTALRSRAEETGAGGEENKYGRGGDGGEGGTGDAGARGDGDGVGVRTRGWDGWVRVCEAGLGTGRKNAVIEPFFDIMSGSLLPGRVSQTDSWMWAVFSSFPHRESSQNIHDVLLCPSAQMSKLSFAQGSRDPVAVA